METRKWQSGGPALVTAPPHSRCVTVGGVALSAPSSGCCWAGWPWQRRI